MVFRVDLRVAAADRLPPVERWVVVVLRRVAVFRRRPAAAFFVVERFLRLWGFFVVPATASAMLVAALDKPSVTASMLVFAASAIVPRTPPSFSLSMLFISLRVKWRERHTESRQGSIAPTDIAVHSERRCQKASSVPRPCRCCCAKLLSVRAVQASAFDARHSFG